MIKTSKRIHPHIRAGRYYNFPGEVVEGFIYHTVHTYVKSLFQGNHKTPATLSHWISHEKHFFASSQPRITWLGHSTFLIQIGNINILTDPIFGNASFLYPRILPVGIKPAQLPRIDCVLISHNHHDHMDTASLMLLKEHENALFLVPAGDKAWFDSRGFGQVREYMWWQQDLLNIMGRQMRMTFLPAHHWSQRGLFDKNRSLWGSWMIECDGYTIYFAGDTAYGEHFLQIADEFPAIDVALMPIGPCLPRAWMRGSHVGPHEAGQAFLDLRAQNFIPMHWGTFAFGVDAFDTPITMLAQWWAEQKAQLGLKQLHLLPVGKACSPEPMMRFGIDQQPVVHV